MGEQGYEPIQMYSSSTTASSLSLPPVTPERLRKEAKRIEKAAKAQRRATKVAAKAARQKQADIELAKSTLREIASNKRHKAYDRESAAHTLLAAHDVINGR